MSKIEISTFIVTQGGSRSYSGVDKNNKGKSVCSNCTNSLPIRLYVGDEIVTTIITGNQRHRVDSFSETRDNFLISVARCSCGWEVTSKTGTEEAKELAMQHYQENKEN